MNAFASALERTLEREILARRSAAYGLSNGGEGGHLARTGQQDRGPGAFARDYGPARAIPQGMEPARLHPDDCGGRAGDSGVVRQGSLVIRAIARFRAEMKSMCPGTRVFYWCALAAGVI